LEQCVQWRRIRQRKGSTVSILTGRLNAAATASSEKKLIEYGWDVPTPTQMREERAQWFEHNTYWALYTSDEYVWCYSERMNWRRDQKPPGLEAAIIRARQKIHEGKSLGFDIEPLIESVKKR
jgi:hypothetical protein